MGSRMARRRWGRGGRRLPGALLRLWVSLWSCSDKFQYFGLKVPQIQLIDGGWVFLLCCRDVYPQYILFSTTVEILQVPLLDWFLTTPGAQFTVVKVVDRSVVAQRQFSLVPTVQQTTEILQLQFIDKVFDVSVVQVNQVPRVVRGDNRDPTVAAR